MKPSSRLAAALLALATSACSSAPVPVPLVAEPTEITAMAGEWRGDYFSATTGRAGGIVFKITAGRDTAVAEVVMIPRGTNTPVRPAEMSQLQLARALAEVLTIRFARIEHGQLSGTLTPYRDPECNCLLQTTFTGRMTNSSTIEGTFVSTSPDLASPQRGTWKVSRVP